MPLLLQFGVEDLLFWTKSKRVILLTFLSKSNVCNFSNENLTRVLWPSCTCSAYIFILLQVSNQSLENCRNCWDTALLRHAYEAKFLSKSRVWNSSNINLIRVLWPLCTCPIYILTLLQVSNHYLENCRSCGAHVQSIFLLCCKFLIIILKTVGVVET